MLFFCDTQIAILFYTRKLQKQVVEFELEKRTNADNKSAFFIFKSLK